MKHKPAHQFDMPIFSEQEEMDEVQRLMFQRMGETLHALWPSELPPPFALRQVQYIVAELITYTMRTERGRASVRKQLIERYTSDATAPAGPHGDESSLLADKHLAIMRARLAIIEWLTVLEGESKLQTEGVADAVDAWLANGGDGKL